MGAMQMQEPSPLAMVLQIVALVLFLVGTWKLFDRAGEKGWKAIIPFYNLYIGVKLFWGGSPWKFLLIFVPIANIVFELMLLYKMAMSFEPHKTAYGVLNIFFAPIVVMVLAFGKDHDYIGPSKKEQ